MTAKETRKKLHYAIEKGISWCYRFGVKTTCVESLVNCEDCKKSLRKWHNENV